MFAVETDITQRSSLMEALLDSELQENLAVALDKVNADHNPLLIMRQHGKPAVLMSLDDFNAYAETAYLLRSPANAARLLKAVDDVENGRLVVKDLLPDD